MKKKLLSLLAGAMVIALMAGGCAPAAGTASSTPPAPSSASGTESSTPSSPSATGSAFDALYAELANLSGQAAIDFFNALSQRGFSGSEIMQFFIDMPVSQANQDIYKLYVDEGFEIYSETYPKGKSFDDFVWEIGMGSTYKGFYSSWDLKGPYTDYIELKDGPVGDPGKTYKIGVVACGMKSAWSTNLHDSIQYEAQKHPNVTIDVQDAEYDNNKLSNIIDMFIAQKVDGILLWPSVEAPSGPPVARAEAAGIPVCTIDRVAGDPNYSLRVAGNFTANGAQNAMYLLQQLADEGSYDCNIVLIRKPLGSTADAIRIGYFLKPLSYIPGIKVLQSYHDTSDKAVAFTNCQAAIQAHPVIDAVMVDGDYESIAMLQALKLANRLDSRKDGKRVILLNVDDSKEAIKAVENGELATTAPYTPMLGDVGLRVLLRKITGEALPQDIITPNIPIVTKDGRSLFGMDTLTPEEWYPYTFGPEV